MVPHPRKVFPPTASNKNNGVFLEVMTNPRNISGHLDSIGQSYSSNFSKSGIGFLGSGCIDSNTNPPFLRGSRKSGGRSLTLDAFPPYSNQLTNCRHCLPHLTQNESFQQVKS